MRIGLATALVAVFLWACAARADVIYSGSSTIRYVHTPGLSSGGGVNQSPLITPRPSSSQSTSSPFDYTRAYSISGTSTLSYAKGGLFHVTNVTTASLAIQAGTGVTQAAGPDLPDFSRLRININQMLWSVTSKPFGPTATGYLLLKYAGSNADAGRSEIEVNINWLDAATNTPLRSSFAQTRIHTLPGVFSGSFLTSNVLNPSTLPTDKQIRITGYVELRTRNDITGLAEMAPDTGIDITDSDIGSGGPTMEFVGPAGTSSWHDTNHWLKVGASDTFPNTAGVRARFGNDFGMDRNVLLTSASRIGHLDVDGTGVTTIARGASGGLINFDATDESGFAVVQHRAAANGFGQLILAAPMRFTDPLWVQVDSLDGTTMVPQTRDLTPGAALTKAGINDLRIDRSLGITGLECREGAILVNSVQRLASDPLWPITAVGDGAIRYNVSEQFSSINLVGNGYLLLSNTNRNVVVTQAVNIASGSTDFATLALQSGGLVVDYTGASPLAAVRQQVVRARNYHPTSLWIGPGITSFLAAADAALAVGLVEGATLFPGGGTFMGQSIDGTTVLARLTFGGDTNLDGDVDVSDFGALASNYNLAGDWLRGDFTYDGIVGLADFSFMASNFNRVLPAATERPAAVPEPRIIGAGIALLVIARRRSARCSAPVGGWGGSTGPAPRPR